MSEIKSCHMSDEELSEFLAKAPLPRPEYVPPLQRVVITGSPAAQSDKRYFRGGFGRRSRKQMHRIAA
jgi:hypothetical protein